MIYYVQLCALRCIYYTEDALLKVMDQMRERERERGREREREREMDTDDLFI